jgi:hypothetical protein
MNLAYLLLYGSARIAMNNYIRRWDNASNINNNRSNYNNTYDCLIDYDDYELYETITVR